MKKILVIGSMNMDIAVSVEHTPVTGETIRAGNMTCSPGGKGANQAYAIGKLGGQVAMLAAVGQDVEGKMFLNNLNSVGVDVSHVRQVPGVSTGTAWIAVDKNGNNSIIVIPGANDAVTPEYIDENVKLLENCDIVVLQLEIPMETVLHSARLAKQMGKLVILDPAPAVAEFPAELVELADIIKPNESELAILTGLEPELYREGAELLSCWGAKNVLVSLGGAGIYMLTESGESAHLPCRQVEAVDTTAAGDSFVAGVAIGLAKEMTLQDSVALGQQIAAITVTRKGAQSAIPEAWEVEEYL